ncbi:MAG: aldolase/citrate lyase family protein [Polyangiaceae bacterium]
MMSPLEERARELLRAHEQNAIAIEPRFFLQRSHLTAPAPVWKYVEGAVKSGADLVMLDLEDSIPRGDDKALADGRANVIRALTTLDWGRSLRFFRPRGLALDPGFTDVGAVVAGAGARLEGVIWPKAEGASEILLLDEALGEAERAAGVREGTIKIGVLIESARAEEEAFWIAGASRRVRSLIFGAFDHFSSLGMIGARYRFDHPMVDAARMRIAKAAASVGVPALGEMTVNYPTKNKSAEEQAAALAELRRDAEHARELGMRGKWVGIPAQLAITHEVFGLDAAEIQRAIEEVRAFQEAERAGRGAAIIGGKMADRATDRQHRVLLSAARALGQIDEATAAALEIA